MKIHNLLFNRRIGSIGVPRQFVRFRKIKAEKPLEHLCMDIKYIHIHGAQRNALLLTVIDAYSRKVLTHMLRFNIKKGDVIVLLSLLLMEYKIENITLRNDNGSQFIAGVVRQFLKEKGVNALEYIATTDYWLEQRINKTCKAHDVKINKNNTSLFLNSAEDIATYFSDKKRMFQSDFYKHQRISRNILLENKQQPVGGKWTYDDENRLKYPKGKAAPKVDYLEPTTFYSDAVTYTKKYFHDNYGSLNTGFIYPTTHTESKNWLQTFFKSRFSEFGAYEDAILSKEIFLHRYHPISPRCSHAVQPSDLFPAKELPYRLHEYRHLL